jgi:signal transduction histidine kinase
MPKGINGLTHMMWICRLILPALLVLLLLQPLYGAEPREAKRVLVLYSEDKDHPAHGLTEQGILKTFRSNKLFDVQLFTEYLDASRFGDRSHARATAEYLRRKYSGMKIHGIIAVYPSAVDFLLAERSTLFPEVPIIASEITGRDYAENLERSPVRRFVSGTILGDNITGIMDAALRMRPETKRIALVAGTAPNDISGEQIFRTGLKPYAGKIDLIDLTKLPMQEILARVGSLPPDTLVLYSSVFRDGAGKTFVPRDALSLIARVATVPVFGLYESYLGFGIVGGWLVSFEEHGKEAAALALRVMGGESPASIHFGGEQAYVSAYDWRELERWGISEKVLPPGSIVKFRSLSIWGKYKGPILGGLFFIIIETLLIFGLLVNLHKRKQAEKEARHRRDELAHVTRVATMGELTSSLAHELNQPLAAIRNYANAAQRFLSQGEPDLSKTREALEGIIRDNRRAAEVIGRVRGLLKKEEPRYRPVHMNHVIQETLTFIRSDSLLEGLSIETELAQGLPAVPGDRVQLQQVLLNLMLNAVDAMNKAKPDLRKLVIQTGNEEDRGVKVSVRDFGSGIDEAHRDKLFEPFYTTKSAGMGMGLAISQRIIHAHGGSIWAENNPDGGATFYFTLPTGNKEDLGK